MREANGIGARAGIGLLNGGRQTAVAAAVGTDAVAGIGIIGIILGIYYKRFCSADRLGGHSQGCKRER